ncbi:MAG: hypothetical protein OXD31_10120 [Chloroflexi bacterium]|nr:hypothetical protein [Chloroflexota bacterium]
MKRNGFWQEIYHLREVGMIDRIWRAAQLNEYLERPRGEYAASTIAVRPHNSCVSSEGDGIGDFVRKGQPPKVWRVGRGLFQLVVDPDDDEGTQHTQMRLALERAEDLRKRKLTTRSNSEVVSTPRSRSVTPPKDDAVSSDRYSIDPFALTEGERKDVEALSTEQKALNIVRSLLKDRYGEDVEIEEDGDGVDLRVTIDGKTERIEVKGTADPTIAWEKLKVSSRRSHDALVSGDATIYRVVDVDSADPRVYVLIHGEDFTLEHEPRWAVKRIPPDNKRYPLRGMLYRYDRPHDPVALEDWEILQ